MQFSRFFIAAFLLAQIPSHFLLAQSLPIAIDGQFDDWTAAAINLEDAGGAGSGLDLVRMSVANDETYLFIRFEIDQEVVLTDGNDLTLYIDGDQNQLTGKSVNGIGAEIELQLGNRNGNFYKGSSTWYFDFGDIGFASLPTFSATKFELAIRRDAEPDGNNPIFTGNKCRIYLQNGAGDKMPNAGQTFSYTFNNDPTPVYQPIDLQKNDPSHLRLMTWNTLADGLLDVVRKPSFERVLKATQPDIITFNECWDMTSAQARTFMNAAIPLGNPQGWYTAKLIDGNITASRYPILQNWSVYNGHRLTASLVDLPDDIFEKDILVINGHLRCCDANSERQLEADAFASFILDAKTPGGEIDLPENTPFVLSGDMNLVGWQQQYTTLTTGDIVNTNVFGAGGSLDWDGSALLDVLALQTDQRMAYTWNEAGSQYPPSRLDFHICSNSVLEVKKAYTLQTEVMSQARLTSFGLLNTDNSTASDHLPKVTDFVAKPLTGSRELMVAGLEILVSPNPASGNFAEFVASKPLSNEAVFYLFDFSGREMLAEEINSGQNKWQVPVNRFPSGMYYWKLEVAGRFVNFGKLLIQQ